MSDIESDGESVTPSTTLDVIDIEIDPSTTTNEKYSAGEIERLLKIQTDPKQYIILKNSSQFIKSDVWNTFGFPAKLQTNGKHRIISELVTCFNCYKTLSYDGSTKYMNKHKCSYLNTPATIEKGTGQGTLDKYVGKKTSIQKHDKEKLKEKLVLWSCSSLRPFSIAEDPGLIDIVKEAIHIGQKYSGDLDVENLLPTAKTISNNVYQLADKYRRELKPILISQADAGCLCIIPDLWSDKHRKIGYIGITCSFVNKNFQQIMIDLCCAEYDEEDKTGASVFLAIRKQLAVFDLEYYFDNKKLMFMSDRGSNIIKALEGHDVLFCFGHRINNVLQRSFYQIIPKNDKEKITTTTTTQSKRRLHVQDSSDEELNSDTDDVCKKPSPSKHPQAVVIFSKLPNKPKELLEMISASKSLVKYVKLTGLNREIQQNNGVALQQSNITRWLSLSSLLRSIEASIEHVRSLISMKSTAEKQKINLSKINIDGLKDMVLLLDTFQDVIKLIQTGDRPTLHMAYVCLNKLQLHLEGKDVDANGDLVLINDRHEGTDFFRQRIRQLLSVMFHLDKKHLAAALLHPQYRKLTFIDEYKRSKTHIYVQQLLTELYAYKIDQNKRKPTTTIPEPVKKKHKTIEEQFVDPDDTYDGTFSSTSSSTTQKFDELEMYLKMTIDDKFKTSNPLSFWQCHEDRLPYLAKLARRLYSIPATSAGVERQFSAAGVLVNERRCSLNPETVEEVMFVRSVQKTLIKYPNLFSS